MSPPILKTRCRYIELPQKQDFRGNLEIIEDFAIPFSIKRVYFLNNVPKDGERGGHAHKALHQLVVAPSGSFHFIVDDGSTKEDIVIKQGGPALYIPPMIWREIINFSENAVCLVLASQNYIESDYIRNYDDFKSIFNAKNPLS